jgi:thiamine biosynthesis lipoprotein
MTAATLPVAAAPPIRVPLAERTLRVPAMGGSLVSHVAYQVTSEDDGALASAVARDLERVARRVGRWAARLTRFSEASDLAALNSDPALHEVVTRPTLTAVLDWAERATDLAPGLIDVTLLDERLAAETGAAVAPMAHGTDRPGRRWHLVRRSRGGLVVRRESCRFDLDGIAKGWIADRALTLLRHYPAALVDADGDIAVRVGHGVSWDIAVADPRDASGADLASIRVDDTAAPGPIGIATSGTSVHRWGTSREGSPRHHLIDPRTRRPAVTDVVQATVIADTARMAEVLAKAVVIAGSDAAARSLEDAQAGGAILLLEDGEIMSVPRTARWNA